jgi:hypothetical protein
MPKQVYSGSAENFQEQVVNKLGLINGAINWPVDGEVDLKTWLNLDLPEGAVVAYNVNSKSITFDNASLTSEVSAKVNQLVGALDREKQMSGDSTLLLEEYKSYRLVKDV